ncbi:MAG TPA: hypothetical protein GXX39_01500 [Syntrophothermus lipocalidus]|uniref:Uncharacterized protein n=1 Tax=Syntrophothermus lipocalidus (strain DSM 12680 / TGB-C1) TaxID=643648 RepID=D7CN38_SYNLT|nr:hypothetical protein [Syntrophothermus lipocalidus]ADI02123.1 conserved hypothetical protein [Syntrophothermus lipocalidus DSM 12680]HHV76034.1 hypothetical protein [Syntrophothermus lipocalidus]
MSEALAPTEPVRKAEINLRLAQFEFPPMQDVLLVGRKAPIGAEAAKRMVEALSPDQYELFVLDHELFEAAVIRKSLLNVVPKESLIPIVLEESSRIADDSMIIKIGINAVIQVSRLVSL